MRTVMTAMMMIVTMMMMITMLLMVRMVIQIMTINLARRMISRRRRTSYQPPSADRLQTAPTFRPVRTGQSP